MSASNAPNDRNVTALPLGDARIPVRDLAACDKAASVAHDFIWDKNGVTQKQASDAIWQIHNAIRPHLPMDDETIAAVLEEVEESRTICMSCQGPIDLRETVVCPICGGNPQ